MAIAFNIPETKYDDKFAIIRRVTAPEILNNVLITFLIYSAPEVIPSIEMKTVIITKIAPKNMESTIIIAFGRFVLE